MGSFYTNITLRGPDQDAVVNYLRALHRKAYVSPTLNGITVVYDQECEVQDPQILDSLAGQLSREFKCVAWVVANYDDDILSYKLYQSGYPIDEYDSTPGYFQGEEKPPAGGSAQTLCSAFDSSRGTDVIETILRRPQADCVVAVARHEELWRALGLPYFMSSLGYKYLDRAEALEGIDHKLLKHTG